MNERVGYPEGVGLPVSLMATLARQLHRDYFVTGSFSEPGCPGNATLRDTGRPYPPDNRHCESCGAATGRWIDGSVTEVNGAIVIEQR